MTTNNTLKLLIISGGISNPSSSLRLAQLIAEAATARLAFCPEEVSLDVLELAPLAHDIADAITCQGTSTQLTKAIAKTQQADGIVVATPVFQGSISGLTKSYFDLLPQAALHGTPVALGVTGGSDRHTLVLESALRPLISYLHGTTVASGVYAASGDWSLDEANALKQRASQTGAELAKWMRLLAHDKLEQQI